MPSKSSSTALLDIAANIHLCRRFVAGMSYKAFCEDLRTVYAATRCLEIISQASRRLPDSMKALYPELPWVDIAGAGNIYRHDYENVREDALWKTIHEPLDRLLVVIEDEIEKLPKD